MLKGLLGMNVWVLLRYWDTRFAENAFPFIIESHSISKRAERTPAIPEGWVAEMPREKGVPLILTIGPPGEIVRLPKIYSEARLGVYELPLTFSTGGLLSEWFEMAVVWNMLARRRRLIRGRGVLWRTLKSKFLRISLDLRSCMKHGLCRLG